MSKRRTGKLISLAIAAHILAAAVLTHSNFRLNDPISKGVFRLLRNNPDITFSLSVFEDSYYPEDTPVIYASSQIHSLMYFGPGINYQHLNFLEEKLTPDDVYNLSEIIRSLSNYEDVEMDFALRLDWFNTEITNFDSEITFIGVSINLDYPLITNGTTINSNGLNLIIENQGIRYVLSNILDEQNEITISMLETHRPRANIPQSLIDRFTRYAFNIRNNEFIRMKIQNFYEEVERFVRMINPEGTEFTDELAINR